MPYKLNVNFTDTKLSHRFIRFEIPNSLDYKNSISQIKDYLNKKKNQKSTTGVVVTNLQEDIDLVVEDPDTGEDKVIAKGSIPETGSRMVTVNMICDI